MWPFFIDLSAFLVLVTRTMRWRLRSNAATSGSSLSFSSLSRLMDTFDQYGEVAYDVIRDARAGKKRAELILIRNVFVTPCNERMALAREAICLQPQSFNGILDCLTVWIERGVLCIH